MQKNIQDRGLSTILTQRGKDLVNLINTKERYKNRYLKNSYRQLKSKKNTVAYVILDGNPRILKWYVPGFKRQLETEYKLLRKGSSTLNIPAICEKDDDNNILIMSFISGENLCDVVNDKKTVFPEKKRLMILLAEWFEEFHSRFKTPDHFYIHGDSILRNFVLSDSIWGVDFEESRKGKPVVDIAGMCSSILTTNPIFTSEKFELCEIFVGSYSKSVKWSLGNIWEEISYSLLEKIQWRPAEEKVIREYSKKIRKNGL
jgi:tRNA A-37 threonylcarbamoyl transferase component Bud32